MDREDFRRLQALYDGACRLPLDERAAFVERASAGDATLRGALFALLDADRPRGAPVGKSGAAHSKGPRTVPEARDSTGGSSGGALSVEAYAEGPGDVFGPYVLLDVLGEGGFGTVYRARQREPVEREVAFKILKLGMDSKQVVARFEAERQLLGRMDHPNIAKVFDAGVTERGRPYFVMELVRGTTLTEYCDAKRLTALERIGLFAKVCRAVQHAHQKGVIHRDLKPSNVLVEEIDGTAVPRVIDFGIAKATGATDADRTILTQEHQLIGTPEYMAPEQALGELDVDTRADVYSLGVLLFELLTGTRPFDFQALLARGYGVLLEHIRDVPAPKPSTRLADLGDERSTVAERRRATPHHLDRLLRGDLDWIAMRALEKDRSRRYASAHELAEDLQRFLRDEVVHAGPPSTWYRMRKFARRHRVACTAAFAVASAILTSVAALAWALAEVSVERDRAREAATEAREERDRASRAVDRTRQERDRAQRTAESARRVSDFLASLFDASDPGESRGEVRTARDLLDAGADGVASLASEPAVANRLRDVLGSVYLRLGEFRAAEPLLEAAAAYFEGERGEEPHAFVESQVHLALLIDQGRGEPEMAETHARRAVEVAATLEDEALHGEARNALALTLWHQGRLDEAAEEFERAVARLEGAHGADDPRVARPLANLGSIHLMAGDLDAAERTYARVIAIEEAQPEPERDFEFATTLHLMALVCQQREEFERAIAYERRSLAIRDAVLGPGHWHVALSLTTLGDLLRETGRAEEALPLQRRAVAITEATWDAHVDLWWSQRSLARTCLALSRFAEARAIAERQVEDLVGTDAAETFAPLCLEIRGAALRGEGRPQDAEPILRDALRQMTERWGVADPDRLRTRALLADVLRQLGRDEEAARLEEDAGGRGN